MNLPSAIDPCETWLRMDWNLESYFPAFDGPEYRRFKLELEQAFAALRARLDAQDTGLEPGSFAGWQAAISAYEEIQRRLDHLASYLGCLTAANSSHEGYRRELAGLAHLEAERNKLEIALIHALGDARNEHFEAFVRRDALADAAFALREWRTRSHHVMDVEQEALAAELEVDGLKAWSRLYDNVAGTLEFTFVGADGSRQRIPMSRRRSLQAHPDRAVRAAAFEGGNAAWSEVAVVCAAALNGIAGTRLTLSHRRNHPDFLDDALVHHRLGRKALDALFVALRDRAEVARDILRRKAARLGLPAIAWYDLEAPTPGGTSTAGEQLTWDDAVARVESAFVRAYPGLAEYLRAMVARRWIDYSPRPAKRPGAFCTHSLLTNETRVFMTFDGAMNDVVTLAHEVGHAWHAHLLRQARPLARQVPMTLAETASTFAEMLLIDGLLEDPALPVEVKRQVLDSQLRQATAFLLDVPARFAFEQRFYGERAEGEVPVSRLRELMVGAQREFFGDTLAPNGEDPMFWASKLHFYIAEVPFYNFPYTVGFLLTRALFARYRQEGADFLPVHERFLARSGATSCETLARDVLGADLESAEFWANAIDGLAGLAERFDALLPPAATGAEARTPAQ